MDILLSHNNHFKFGYDGRWFGARTSSEQKWVVQYGRCERHVGTFREECLQNAKQIYKDAQNKLVLLFSGGVDSEVALRSFVNSNIPISAAILRFKNDLNIHDISYAIIMCERLGVPYRFYDLDILDFWNTRLLEYADPTYCVSPQLLSTMWLADQVEGYPVLGSGECLLVKEIPDDYIPGTSPYLPSEWHLYEKEKIAAWYRHFIHKKRSACPGFFQYTPEVMLAYLQDPFVEKLVNNQFVGKLSTASSKLEIYQNHFDLIDRPKFSGFEKIEQHDPTFRRLLTAKFPGANQTYKTNVSYLRRRLSSPNNYDTGPRD